jgi:ABC-2 type transport system ATP-binding protein
VVTLRVDAGTDVRVALSRALVEGGLGLLQVGPGERELESVFLELATPSQAEKAAPRRKRKAEKKAGAQAEAKGEKAGGEETAAFDEGDGG